jgi:L-serine dehydratase
MALSVIDLFTIGIGPSSSHTVGPMRAAHAFVLELITKGLVQEISAIRCDLYGSLAATGKGHGTDQAILMGYLGQTPEGINPSAIPDLLRSIREDGRLRLANGQEISFSETDHLIFKRSQVLPRHPNGMHFTALNPDNSAVHDQVYYSLGGGFIAREQDWAESSDQVGTDQAMPHPFSTAAELLTICKDRNLTISDVMLANESVLRPETELRDHLKATWAAMQGCVHNGLNREGTLPGGLRVRRRAPAIHRKLQGMAVDDLQDPLILIDWVNLYALAVGEENAAGGRVVTAPTNGAAGIIPAVLHYATRFKTSSRGDAVDRFLLTAGAMGILYKKNASISGADVGCQGEVGVACSMAAAGLTEYLEGNPQQVENAAEIGMEHNLGLTCDPVGGLVQIPCIERNAMGAVKAINAARMALSGDGRHYVSLDKVIKTMWETGQDMTSKYKETSRGGLAVNVVEC